MTERIKRIGCSKLTGVLLAMVAGASVSVVQARQCHDVSYDPDADGENEIRLASHCTYRFVYQTFKQTIDNLTDTDHYVVDYKSAGFYQSPVEPYWVYTQTVGSGLSCTKRNLGADFTRSKPNRHKRVTVATAPACVPGYVLIPLLNKLTESDTVEFDTALARERPDGSESTTLLAARSQIQWDRDQELYRYTFTLVNAYDEPVNFFVSSAPSPDNPEGWAGSVEAHSSTELVYELSSSDEQNHPVENFGAIEYVVGEDSAEGVLRFIAISPDSLTPAEQLVPQDLEPVEPAEPADSADYE